MLLIIKQKNIYNKTYKYRFINDGNHYKYLVIKAIIYIFVMKLLC